MKPVKVEDNFTHELMVINAINASPHADGNQPFDGVWGERANKFNSINRSTGIGHKHEDHWEASVCTYSSGAHV